MSRKIVQITNIHRQYRVGEVVIEALRGIDLEVEEGEFVVVQGPVVRGSPPCCTS